MAKEIILVIEDNVLNLKMMTYLLEAKDYIVHTAMSAEEALEKLQKIKPALILMDIQLPGMDGLTLTQQLKTNLKFYDIPIIAITAYAMAGDEEKALRAGCDYYIPKPINTRTLPGLIASFIKKK